MKQCETIPSKPDQIWQCKCWFCKYWTESRSIFACQEALRHHCSQKTPQLPAIDGRVFTIRKAWHYSVSFWCTTSKKLVSSIQSNSSVGFCEWFTIFPKSIALRNLLGIWAWGWIILPSQNDNNSMTAPNERGSTLRQLTMPSTHPQ